MRIHHREWNNKRYEEVSVDEVHGTHCERCNRMLQRTFFIWEDGAFVCDKCIDELLWIPQNGKYARGDIFD